MNPPRGSRSDPAPQAGGANLTSLQPVRPSAASLRRARRGRDAARAAELAPSVAQLSLQPAPPPLQPPPHLPDLLTDAHDAAAVADGGQSVGDAEGVRMDQASHPPLFASRSASSGGDPAPPSALPPPPPPPPRSSLVCARCGEVRCPGPQLPPPLRLTSEDEFVTYGRIFGYALPPQASTVLMGQEHTAYRVPGSMSLYELAVRLAHTARFGRGGCYNWFAGEDSPEADEFARVLRECLPALLSAPGACWLPAAAAGAPAAATTAAATADPAAVPDAAAARDVMDDESGMVEEGDGMGVFSDFEEDDDYLEDCYDSAFAPLT